MNAASDASVQQVIKNAGVVKDIDMNSKKITISHEAIPAVGWPAMTMRFTFVNADDAINALKMATMSISRLFSRAISPYSKALTLRNPDYQSGANTSSAPEHSLRDYCE